VFCCICSPYNKPCIIIPLTSPLTPLYTSTNFTQMDCVTRFALSLGLPSSLALQWRSQFLSFGAFCEFLSFQWKKSFRLVFDRNISMCFGLGPFEVSGYIYMDLVHGCYHIDPVPNLELISHPGTFALLPFTQSSLLFSTMNVYSNPRPTNLLPTPSGRSSGRPIGLRNTGNRGRGRGRGNRPPTRPVGGQINVPPQSAFVAPAFPSSSVPPSVTVPPVLGGAVAASVVSTIVAPSGPPALPINPNAPVAPPMPLVGNTLIPGVQMPDLVWWKTALRSMPTAPGSEAAEEFYREHSMNADKVSSHGHPLSRAQRTLRVLDLMALWYSSNFTDGVPMRWVNPSSNVRGLFMKFERVRSKSLARLVSKTGSPWNVSRAFNTLNPTLTTNLVIVVDTCEFSGPLNSWSHYAPGSAVCVRSFTGGDFASFNDGEISIEPTLLPVDVHTHGFTSLDLTVETVKITVSGGSGVYYEPANLIYLISVELALAANRLYPTSPPESYGDYGIYRIVPRTPSIVRPRWLRVGVPFPLPATYVPQIYHPAPLFAGIYNLPTQTKVVDLIDVDPWWWWLFGERLYDWFPTLITTTPTRVLNFPADPINFSSTAIGSSFTSAALHRVMDTHPVMKSHPNRIAAKELLTNSIVYYASELAQQQRTISRLASCSGSSFGTMDENRNVFSLGGWFSCCGIRNSHNPVL